MPRTVPPLYKFRLRLFLWERAVLAVVPGGTEPSVLKTGVYWPGTKPGPAAAERALMKKELGRDSIFNNRMRPK